MPLPGRMLVVSSQAGYCSLVLKIAFYGAPVYALALGGVSFLIAGLLVLRWPKEKRA